MARNSECLRCKVPVNDVYWCETCEALFHEQSTGYWIITRFWLTEAAQRNGLGVPYPFWVEGRYKVPPKDGKPTFFWGVNADAVDDFMYNWDEAKFKPYEQRSVKSVR